MLEAYGEHLAFLTILSVFAVIVAYKIWMPLEASGGSIKEIDDIG